MKLSTRSRYGLRALIDLAFHYNDGPVPLREVAERQNLPENYLEHLMAALRRGGIIKSVRGPSGGYYLNRAPQDITLGDIFRLLEGPIAPAECSASSEGTCSSPSDCFVFSLWQELSDEINNVFDSKTLADVLKGADEFARNKSLK